MDDQSKSDDERPFYERLAESAANARARKTSSEHQPPPPGRTENKETQKRSTNVMLSKGDYELLAVIQDRLSVGKGEAIRTAIRVYAALLQRE